MNTPILDEILDFLRSYAAYTGWVEERGTRPPHCPDRSDRVEDLFDRLRYTPTAIVRGPHVPLADLAPEMARVIVDMDDRLGFGEIHTEPARALVAMAERLRPLLAAPEADSDPGVRPPGEGPHPAPPESP